MTQNSEGSGTEEPTIVTTQEHHDSNADDISEDDDSDDADADALLENLQNLAKSSR